MNFSVSLHALRKVVLSLTFLGALQPIAGAPSFSSFGSRAYDYASSITPGTWLGGLGLGLGITACIYSWWNIKKLNAKLETKQDKNTQTSTTIHLEPTDLSNQQKQLISREANTLLTEENSLFASLNNRIVILEAAREAAAKKKEQVGKQREEARSKRQATLQEAIRQALQPQTDKIPTLERQIRGLQQDVQAIQSTPIVSLEKYNDLLKAAEANVQAIEQTKSYCDNVQKNVVQLKKDVTKNSSNIWWHRDLLNHLAPIFLSGANLAHNPVFGEVGKKIEALKPLQQTQNKPQPRTLSPQSKQKNTSSGKKDKRPV